MRVRHPKTLRGRSFNLLGAAVFLMVFAALVSPSVRDPGVNLLESTPATVFVAMFGLLGLLNLWEGVRR